MRYEIRPLGAWDRPVTSPRVNSSRFRAMWQSTLDLLCREVEFLGGTLIAIQIDVQDGQIRRDGMLAAKAKVGFPGVKVSFDSRHGPLTYATDTYEQAYYSDPPGWQANVRAIALALEALRAVDRYGVSSSGEQYRGWTAIAAAPANVSMSRDQAAELLATSSGYACSRAEILSSSTSLRHAYREAARKYYPDAPAGDAELFGRLTAARDLLLVPAVS